MSKLNDLDATDLAILRLIQADASLSLGDIAKEVGLTQTPCWKRIRRMEETGIITGRVTLVNAESLALAFQFLSPLKPAIIPLGGLKALPKQSLRSPKSLNAGALVAMWITCCASWFLT